MENILEIRDLVVSYGGIEAVKGIRLDVPKGKIVTLIGSNGAGKSTTLKTIAGLVKPKSGSVVFEGETLSGKPSDYIVSKGITLVPEGRRVFANLSVEENLRIGAYLRKDSLKADLENVYGLFPRLRERAWQLAGTLSGGEQQMLAVGRALMSRPKLIMMDEPSLGLAPIIVKGIFDIIRAVNEQAEDRGRRIRHADRLHPYAGQRQRAARERGRPRRLSRQRKVSAQDEIQSIAPACQRRAGLFASGGHGLCFSPFFFARQRFVGAGRCGHRPLQSS